MEELSIFDNNANLKSYFKVCCVLFFFTARTDRDAEASKVFSLYYSQS